VIATGSLRFDLDLRGSLERRLGIEALVVQQDRNLIMGPQAPLDLDADLESEPVYRAATRHRPLAQGRFLVLPPTAGRTSWLYQAVIHDLESSPSCRPGDVRRCLTAVLEDAARRGLSSLATEPLGMFGRRGLSQEEMVDAFDAVVMEVSPTLTAPVRLALLLDDMAEVERISLLLRSKLLRQATRSFRTVNGDAAVVEVRRDGARLHFRFVPGSLSGYVVSRAPALV